MLLYGDQIDGPFQVVELEVGERCERRRECGQGGRRSLAKCILEPGQLMIHETECEPRGPFVNQDVRFSSALTRPPLWAEKEKTTTPLNKDWTVGCAG
jgi:hypothetical protein